MKRAILVLLAAALTGCSHGKVSINSSTSHAGTTSQGSSVHVRASGGAALLVLGVIAVASGAPGEERPAPMAPDRRINEQDCTQPIDLTAGNLRCK